VGICPGERRTIYIPSKLAYGEKGIGLDFVPPNSDLVYDVECVRVRHLTVPEGWEPERKSEKVTVLENTPEGASEQETPEQVVIEEEPVRDEL